MDSPTITQDRVDSQLVTNLKFADHWSVLTSQLWDFATTSTHTSLTINCKDGQMAAHSPICYTFFKHFNIRLSEQLYSEDKVPLSQFNCGGDDESS